MSLQSWLDQCFAPEATTERRASTKKGKVQDSVLERHPWAAEYTQGSESKPTGASSSSGDGEQPVDLGEFVVVETAYKDVVASFSSSRVGVLDKDEHFYTRLRDTGAWSALDAEPTKGTVTG